ncbi:hypothetical protein AXG93_3037s1110 [Marchantia polymorpha subsp. ruderalis]|uniref:Uncharacterized protein n=1 Tax=Marchantia polymorpha subsp. ruderalis TaxID=1480154 RepID=A0A176WL48_MARPO|nr:hypothetical protein AXG93_3037s1110 [Marchantia polymorpha subsp. ruderalis]
MAVGLYCMTRFLNYLFFFLRYRVKVSLYHSLESSLAVLLDVTAMPTRAEAAAQPSPAQPPRLEKNASRSRAPAQPSPPSQAPEQSRTERRKRLREECGPSLPTSARTFREDDDTKRLCSQQSSLVDVIAMPVVSSEVVYLPAPSAPHLSSSLILLMLKLPPELKSSLTSPHLIFLTHELSPSTWSSCRYSPVIEALPLLYLIHPIVVLSFYSCTIIAPRSDLITQNDQVARVATAISITTADACLLHPIDCNDPKTYLRMVEEEEREHSPVFTTTDWSCLAVPSLFHCRHP